MSEQKEKKVKDWFWDCLFFTDAYHLLTTLIMITLGIILLIALWGWTSDFREKEIFREQFFLLLANKTAVSENEAISKPLDRSKITSMKIEALPLVNKVQEILELGVNTEMGLARFEQLTDQGFVRKYWSEIKIVFADRNSPETQAILVKFSKRSSTAKVWKTAWLIYWLVSSFLIMIAYCLRAKEEKTFFWQIPWKNPASYILLLLVLPASLVFFGGVAVWKICVLNSQFKAILNRNQKIDIKIKTSEQTRDDLEKLRLKLQGGIKE